MNILIFFTHVIVMMIFIGIALRMGKHALISTSILLIVLANLFVTKQMEIFGLTITCTEVYTIGAMFIINLIQTYFDTQTAKQTTLLAVYTLILVGIMSQFQVQYTPSIHDTTHEHFKNILTYTPRMMGTSICVGFLTQRLDILLFNMITHIHPKTPLWVRFIGSASISQAFDTLFFTVFALYGIIHSLLEVALMSYLIKILTIITITITTPLIKKWKPHAPIQV